jgi:hypothetical protein
VRSVYGQGPANILFPYLDVPLAVGWALRAERVPQGLGLSFHIHRAGNGPEYVSSGLELIGVPV